MEDATGGANGGVIWICYAELRRNCHGRFRALDRQLPAIQSDRVDLWADCRHPECLDQKYPDRWTSPDDCEPPGGWPDVWFRELFFGCDGWLMGSEPGRS